MQRPSSPPPPFPSDFDDRVETTADAALLAGGEDAAEGGDLAAWDGGGGVDAWGGGGQGPLPGMRLGFRLRPLRFSAQSNPLWLFFVSLLPWHQLRRDHAAE